MNSWIHRFLFQLDPERAHQLVIGALKHSYIPTLLKLSQPQLPEKPVKLWGLTFKHPVGLAAGFDKDGLCIDAWSALGFSFVEVGTVTPKPQAGQVKPRLFRVPEVNAIINRMGFNNLGVDHLVTQLKKKQSPIIVGVNIGKNKDTPMESSHVDYLICMEKVYPYADYITVNISSPNTADLRSIQQKELLHPFLERLKVQQSILERRHRRYVPLLLKVAPDLDDEAIEEISSSLIKFNIDGLVATNTTINKTSLVDSKHAHQEGGLSGAPLQEHSTQVIAKFHQYLNDSMPIIGVGGIQSANDAQQKIDAGASLVQLYSGFIYKGNSLMRDICECVNLESKVVAGAGFEPTTFGL